MQNKLFSSTHALPVSRICKSPLYIPKWYKRMIAVQHQSRFLRPEQWNSARMGDLRNIWFLVHPTTMVHSIILDTFNQPKGCPLGERDTDRNIRAHSRYSPLTEGRTFFEVPLNLALHVSGLHIESPTQRWSNTTIHASSSTSESSPSLLIYLTKWKHIIYSSSIANSKNLITAF